MDRYRRGRDGRFDQPINGVSRTDIADLLRAAAAGYVADGDADPERIARIRKSARILEGRERPGEVRKHRRGAS
jgi:hypothetical protein